MDATLRQLLEALHQTEMSASPDATLILYFSGLSLVDPSGRALLALADSDPHEEFTMLGLVELRTALARIAARRQLVFLDSSFPEPLDIRLR